MDRQRRVLITGCGRGLGRVMALEFARQGYPVAGCCRAAADTAELVASLRAPHRFETVDVASESQVAAWAEELLAEWGPPDLLINNAAVINENAVLWEVPVEEFSRVVDVNIKGVFLVLRSFLPTMVRRGQGVIVNLSSGWGRSTSPEVGPYCTTKWAIEGLTRTLAQELPAGMAAIPLNPGVIDTDMLRSCFGGAAGSYPNPEQWVRRAVPFILGLGPKQNGRPLTVP